MAITLEVERQYPLVARVEVATLDLTSSVAELATTLPVGSILTGGHILVNTAWDSGTSDVITVGDNGNSARYLGSTTIAATGFTPLVPTGFTTTNTDSIEVTWVGVGAAPTVGTLTLQVEYVVADRGNEAQP